MDFDMLFFANPKESSTKSLIIRVLAAHAKFSNVEIQRIIRKDFGRKISYQAIRQALLELMDSNVLKKEGKLYAINKEWILDLKDLVNILEKSIMKKQEIKFLDKQTTQVNLKNLYELGYFVLFSLEHKYFDLSKKHNLFVQINHLWIPFSDMNKRQRLKEMLKDNNTKVMVKNNSLGDKILSLWHKKYSNVKLGTNFSSDCEYIVHGDCVIQIYMDKKLIKKMDDVYKLKSILKLNLMKQLTEMTYNPYPIQIIITRNPKIAQQIKEKINSYF